MNLSPAPLSREEAARRRLDRLEGYLKGDPSNSTLLADAFETAVQCGEWDRARFHLAHGGALEPGNVKWRLREGDLLLARREYDAAIELLERIRSEAAPRSGLDRVVAQNLAFAQFQRGALADCIELLRPLVTGTVVAPLPSGSLQQLWLRALHRAGQLENAVQWAKQAEQGGWLDAGAAGVASLIAFDLDDHALAARWIELAKATPASSSLEAIVARAGLSLARQDTRQAVAAADEALKTNPREGRAWSIRAFAQLVAGDAQSAQASFTQAVHHLPDHVENWQGQGWCQLLLGQWPQAQRSFEAALRLDPQDAASHSGLAMCLLPQQKEDAARAALARAMELDPADPAANFVKAVLSGELAAADAASRLVSNLFK